MNYTIKSNSSAARMPEVGEPWMHKSRDEVFIRIPDKEGKRAIFGEYDYHDEHLFYSVSLTNGEIYNSDRNRENIIILQPETPIVFVPKVS